MKLYPVLSKDRRSSPPPHTVPWEWIAQFERQAVANHGQTLQRMAERGGMGWCEILAIATGQNLRGAFKLCHELGTCDAQTKVLELVAAWEATR